MNKLFIAATMAAVVGMASAANTNDKAALMSDITSKNFANSPTPAVFLNNGLNFLLKMFIESHLCSLRQNIVNEGL